MPFVNRVAAGRQLAARLKSLPGDPVVLGLPRGGVPVAAEVARALDAPLDVILVRKLGVPGQPELAMGAIGEGGVQIANDDVLRAVRITESQWATVARGEQAELQRRAKRFRGDRGRVDLAGRVAVLVDDGMATGATARAACQVARALGATHVVLAVPVASPSAIEALRPDVDEIVCLESPSDFRAVGEFYDDFSQTTDDEVVSLLGRSSPPATSAAATAADVQVTAGRVRLPGRLTVPDGARLIVVFAHGSGSSRHSPRNQLVADVLNRAGLGTLLFDLLTPTEEGVRSNVFDIEKLGRRLADATRWLQANPATQGLDVAFFGASTGAGAAVWAAAEPDLDVRAVVSRGGRPDLAGPRLAAVRAPTLLIVGSRDEHVLALNRRAAAQLRCEKRVAVVPGATHLFEEPGTLQAAAELARDWFTSHLRTVAAPTGTVTPCPGCATRNRVPVAASGIPRCSACHETLPWVVDAGADDFDAAIATGMPVLVDLWAPWCAPCSAVAPVVERAALELAGQVKVVMVNLDDAPEVAHALSVESIPTLVLIRDGRIVGRHVGAAGERRLLEWIRTNVARSAA
jgi:putative phosphoribosyl transferase